MENKQSNIRALLLSNDEKIVKENIEKLRESGTDNDLVLLAEIYKNIEPNDIKFSISQLFSDVQNQKSTDTIVRLIKTTDDKSVLKMLISSCWQSRLNYIDHFELFIDMLLHEPFEIAFEAFTVIESFEEITTQSRISALVEYVNKNLETCKPENTGLADDLVKIIENYSL